MGGPPGLALIHRDQLHGRHRVRSQRRSRTRGRRADSRTKVPEPLTGRAAGLHPEAFYYESS